MKTETGDAIEQLSKELAEHLVFLSKFCVECGENFELNPVEGTTELCAKHNKLRRDAEKRAKKDAEKLALKLSKKREPRAKPNNHKNTYLCWDGNRVSQKTIDEKLRRHYAVCDTVKPVVCEGCGNHFVFRNLQISHAHIIPQARCKAIGKTELIWCRQNWFYGCLDCNAAIENPKGSEWKTLKNIHECMEFIREHDGELFQKFLNNGYQAKIKSGVTI